MWPPRSMVAMAAARRPAYGMGVLALAALLASACASAPLPESFDNPIIREMYTADVSALVHRDRLYIYAGHDTAPKGHRDYVMDDWYAFSTTDFRAIENHGPALKVADFAWASGRAWASQVTERNGKFYWYVCVDQPSTGGMAIGVAVADGPTGPFRDAIGKPLITSNMTPFPGQGRWTFDDIDPTVFVDDDGRAYLFFGNTRLKYVKLNPDMVSVDTTGTPSGQVAEAIVPVTLPRVARLGFTEAPWLHKYEGKYYLSYAAGWSEQLVYCTSDTPTGPWQPGRQIMGYSYNCNTAHAAIVEYRGVWLILHHDGSLPGGDSWHRSVRVDRLSYDADGAIRPITPRVEPR